MRCSMDQTAAVALAVLQYSPAHRNYFLPTRFASRKIDCTVAFCAIQKWTYSVSAFKQIGNRQRPKASLFYLLWVLLCEPFTTKDPLPRLAYYDSCHRLPGATSTPISGNAEIVCCNRFQNWRFTADTRPLSRIDAQILGESKNDKSFLILERDFRGSITELQWFKSLIWDKNNVYVSVLGRSPSDVIVKEILHR